MVEVLLSCMHRNTVEEVKELVRRTNVNCDCVVISQCDRDDYYREGNLQIVFTTERGLSKSRNLAIQYANDSSKCLICDDDEVLQYNVEEIIEKAYSKHPDATLIAFALKRDDLNGGKRYPLREQKLGFRQIMRTSSQQISFKKSSLLSAGITFDEMMGSGTGNGGGEENKFLLDFKRHGLKMFYCPDVIATILPSESQWFDGFTQKYVRNLGWTSRRAIGALVGLAYIHYWVISHRHLYKQHQSFTSAYINILKGYFDKR